MRKWALIITIIGLCILLFLLFSKPKEIDSLENIQRGTLVSIKGIVSEEKSFQFGKTFKVNKIPVFCECNLLYNEKKVKAIGVVEDYYDLRVRILEIKIIDNE